MASPTITKVIGLLHEKGLVDKITDPDRPPLRARAAHRATATRWSSAPGPARRPGWPASSRTSRPDELERLAAATDVLEHLTARRGGPMTRLRAFGSDTFRSLRVRNFRLFFVGQIISQTGTWMQMIAIGLLVLAITDSGVAVGLVTAAQFLPILVLGAWGGVLADRRDRHHLLIVDERRRRGRRHGVRAARAERARGAVVGVPAHLRGRHRRRPREPGPPGAGHRPRRRAGRAERRRAQQHADDDVTGVRPRARRRAHRRPRHRLVLRRQRHLLRAAALALPAHGPRRSSGPPTLVAKAKGQLREGLRYVWAQPELRLPLLLVTAVGTMAFNFSVILPLFATRDLDGSATTFTTMMSIMSLGSVIGALTIARRTAGRHRVPRALHAGAGRVDGRPRRSPRAPLTAYLAVVPVGITSIMVISGSNAVVQLATDPAMRGRVLALLAVVFLGSTPIGGPITGWISETFGARWALALGAVTSLAAGAPHPPSPPRLQGRRGQAPRHRHASSPPPSSPPAADHVLRRSVVPPCAHVAPRRPD